ncbi:aldehyde dehydrogenase family protein [Pseudonocardia sp. T1-2H]|uniref:aldehyde dehydrogenase family protein n=1 Tax=Pseudonocardia sp. T1-2H TaxID=3128899 RepID=UPI003101900C
MHSAPSVADTASSVRTGRSVDPAAPGRTVHTYHVSSTAEVRAAVTAADAAAAAWAATPPLRRAAVLTALADLLERRVDELAVAITREEGKAIAAARGEVGKSAEQFRLAAQLAYLVEGTTFPVEGEGTFTYTVRGPLGVVTAITPWNFPLSLVARKIAPALAAGNVVVLKPSPVTAGVASLLVDLAVEAGLPADVLPLVQGHDTEAMAALLGDERVRAVTFTGSDAVGALVRAQAHGQARLQLELGGRNAAVVCADADLGKAAADVAAGAFGLTGQACTSTDRVLVTRTVAEEFMTLLADRVRALKVGPGDLTGVTTGPVATAAQFDRLHELKDSAIAAGARVVAEASTVDGLDPHGYWVAPTLFADVPPEHPLVAGEVFGPFCSVVLVGSSDQALDIVNSSTHGLVVAVHTADLAVAHRFAARARCGIVKINAPTTGNGVAPPFGGWKASSGGAFPEGGRQALDFFTDTKTVYLSHGEN